MAITRSSQDRYKNERILVHISDDCLKGLFDLLQCVGDIIAFVIKFYTLFTHSLVAYLVADPENGLILSNNSKMGWIICLKIVLSVNKG